jgi:N6-L-threonylcarbamoyladenine synthase
MAGVPWVASAGAAQYSPPAMKILGIETSCDETAAAVVTAEREVLADLVLSQLTEHLPYGGVVPEIAARSHLDHLDRLIAEAMAQAGLRFDQLDGVAATGGPGLIGGVIVGVTMGKAIAAAHHLPFLAVNHLEGHALSARLVDDLPFPYLLLLVSGGHCQLLMVDGVGRYRRLGTTVDDAAGEAFDKTAKLLGLGYPGGPAVEQAAARAAARAIAADEGDGTPVPDRFELPRPMRGRPGCDFSFSGLKTAVRQRVAALAAQSADGRLNESARDDLAAAFQAAVAESIADRVRNAIAIARDSGPVSALVVAGGVAANSYLRAWLEQAAAAGGLRLVAPPARPSPHPAALIARAGLERLKLRQRDGLHFAPRPRWPLDPTAPKAIGAGVKA